MTTDPLICLSLVLHSKDKRVYHITSRKCDEYKLFIEFLFLVNASTDHYGASYYRWWVVLYIQPSPRSHPVSLLKIVYQ